MKYLLIAAATLIATLSAQAGEMTGTVKEVNKEKMEIILSDGMSAMAGDAMKIDGVMAGDKVKIMTDDKNMIMSVEKM